jgi:hypothetical protein
LHPLILLFAAALPVFIAAFRGSLELRQRLRRWLVFLAVIAALLLLCQGTASTVGHFVQSLWVPRYLGIVWPPMCVGLILLIFRLPTRLLRMGCIIVLLGLNLFSFGARLLADTEPPVDHIVADIGLGRSNPNRVHTIVQMTNREWGPGGGSMYNHVGEYYLSLDRWQRGLPLVSPQILHDGDAFELYDFDADLTPGAIHRLLARRPNLRRLIVWTDEDLSPAPAGADEIAQSLGPSWKLLRDQRWIARDHWSWKSLYVCRRREYQRVR